MSIEAIFHQNRNQLSFYVDNVHIETIQKEFFKEKRNRVQILNQTDDEATLLFGFLQQFIYDKVEEAKSLAAMIREMRKEIADTIGEALKEQIILEYAFRFNPSKTEQREDRKAFDRWFDEDALSERILAKITRLQRLTIVAIGRFTENYLYLAESTPVQSIWMKYDLNRHYLHLFEYRDEPLLTHEVLKSFMQLIKPLESKEIERFVDKKLVASLYIAALSTKEDVWIQNDVIAFIYKMSDEYFLQVSKKHFQNLAREDGIFIRHHIAKLCMKLSNSNNEAAKFINETIAYDPSPYVRQALAKMLFRSDCLILEDLKEQLILKDPEISVRALALAQILKPELTIQQKKHFYPLIWRSIEGEVHPFVLKTALYCIREIALRRNKLYDAEIKLMGESWQKLEALLQSDATVQIKRYAAMVRECVWLHFVPDRIEHYYECKSFVESIEVGKRKSLPKSLRSIKREELFRLLSIVAQEDFSLEFRYPLVGAPQLRRGDVFKTRMWRILHELRNPSPDKRQAFPHTIARIYEGVYHFPSAIMAEQAPTKVPGEPYLIPEEESGRPYLPLPDHFLSSLTQSTLKIESYHLYSADGVTTITPPRYFWQRLTAKLKITLHFAKIAALRNWRSGFIDHPNTYIQEMRKLGYGVQFEAYTDGDTSIKQFFSPILPLPFVDQELMESLQNYFFSAYENTLGDLLIFMVVIFGFFFIRHVVISKRIQKARNGIPLTIGGWGTRGKSGTERLKAALFNGMGYRVFSKTTGNEAMFLHSESFQRMIEMFLFRPYDKATIWEQANVIELANKLDIDIFLWESMGLTPAYVEILQHRWMHDDIATITNTYPDHENLQGPAGINIPQVMTIFIPTNSTLVSTEEVMAPILKNHAAQIGTKYRQRGWLQAGLIAPDILSRFPYEEHPNNIALVLGVAQELGIDEDMALKTMADYIVPDLGVLKAYPPSHIGSKTLSFINGMSANERFGALGNWKRMGFDRIDYEKEPQIHITAVINNRMDRVARSRVFASMVVEDIVADNYVLIGTNLFGFQSYIEESWELYKEKLQLYAPSALQREEILYRYARKYRLICTKQQLRTHLEIMLNGSKKFDKEEIAKIVEGLEDELEIHTILEHEQEILGFYLNALEQYKAFEKLLTVTHEEHEPEIYNNLLQNYIHRFLMQKVIIVEDYHATGNEVILHLLSATPPGKHNRIIGIQNIKGTGLNFAYQWVEWERCYKICNTILEEQNSKTVIQAVDALALFDRHSVLMIELIEASLAHVKKAIYAQNEYLKAQIHLIEETMAAEKPQLMQIKEKKVSHTFAAKAWEFILQITKEFFDAEDTVRRRKRANQIYKDLTRFRISHKRASAELKKIMTR